MVDVACWIIIVQEGGAIANLVLFVVLFVANIDRVVLEELGLCYFPVNPFICHILCECDCVDSHWLLELNTKDKFMILRLELTS